MKTHITTTHKFSHKSLESLSSDSSYQVIANKKNLPNNALRVSNEILVWFPLPNYFAVFGHIEFQLEKIAVAQLLLSSWRADCANNFV